MLLNEINELYPLLDRPGKVGNLIIELFEKVDQKIEIKEIKGKQGSTEFIKIIIKGKTKTNPTLGIIGTLGGIGARPEQIGFVSDGDGALTALAVALRLARMKKNGDLLQGNVIITTHLCTNSPTEPHDPVPFMGSPISIETMNKFTVDKRMDAILSIDTSRGNRIINTNGFAISPTVKEGWILRVSEDLLSIMQQITGALPYVLPISMQDITPYANNLYHFNSIMQPATKSDAPVVGVAITSLAAVPGSATGVSNAFQVDQVGRFVIETAQQFTKGSLQFFDKYEFKKITKLYGNMKKLQRAPKRRPK